MIFQENSAGCLEAPSAARAMEGQDDPAVLARILDPDCQLAIWHRPRPDGLQWIDVLDWDAIEDIVEQVRAAAPEATVRPALADAGYPDGDGTDALCDEVCTMVRHFARVMAVDALRMRLEVIDTNACRKFHMDHVKARLLMPLSGPGTQWIHAADGPDAPVNTLTAGEVGLFKGRIWTEEPAILHRSPPIDGTGQSRLLLVLDPLETPADAGKL